MDNLTHSLVGWTLGQTGLKRKSRKGLAALILGANAPDIDVFFGWAPWAPLATHRGWTHSFLGGVLILPLGLAGLLWLLDRWQLRRGQVFKSGLDMRFGWLVALSYIGCLTHPLLDWQTSYAIQLFTPFDKRWYHNDSLFIIDVWIWLALGFAVWLSKRREKSGQGGWRRPAIVAAFGVLAYISANGVLSQRAFAARIAELGGAPPDVVVVAPPPIAFWQRHVIWRFRHLIGSGRYDPVADLTYDPAHSLPVSDGMTDPLARKVLRDDPRLARFRRWSILPMAAIERHRCYVRISYGDGRFGLRPGRARLGQAVAVATGAPGC
jgi:inner membrane protein